MQDVETESLWSQVSGKCIMGSLVGVELELFNSSHTTFSEFVKQYPQGKVLKKPEKGNAGSYYERYFADSTKLGIFGRVDSFESFPAKEYVFGLRLSGKNVAVSKRYLTENSFAFIQNNPLSVLVVFDKNSNTVSAFYASGEFKNAKVVEGKIELGNTVWKAGTGVLLKGDGENLDQVPIITAFWFAWASFFPETELIE
jgi:hypothetical protein